MINAWWKLGECYEAMFVYGRAVSCYERALKSKPEFQDKLVESIGRISSVGFWRKTVNYLKTLWGN